MKYDHLCVHHNSFVLTGEYDVASLFAMVISIAMVSAQF